VLCDALFEEDKQTIFEALCFALNEDSAMEFGQVYLKLAEASKKMGYIHWGVSVLVEACLWQIQ
jgi:hypothetical protein